ncbi:hypothetical protein HNP38_000423 [Chryseobacterium defluvii]|uniref:DUF4349 domain-containing protein n=1 Tax=Chryseobacterium defluvii TaxID=160396 RepID=A0A840K6J7_9FLAO|nr:DUF4349 domain-containing protein [Chryseobacterium defluvii]MBB4805151.1 hypothetical protein [Chryseobacterium defluvii]
MKNLILPLFCLILIHCNKSESIAGEASALQIQPPNEMSEKLISEDKVVATTNIEMPPPPPSSPNEQTSSKKTDTISKKIIKNGNMTIQVGDLKKAHIQINETIKKYNAYTQNENFQNTDTDENLGLIIRVPHKNFDALINSFSDGIGSVQSKSISSDDVTEEYTDVSIKLSNKKIYLEKYRDLLKKAGSTKDMLDIQEKIRGLEDEIDVAEGKLRFIDDRVNYSTLNLSLYKEKARSSATSKIGFGNRFADSLTEGWNSFVSFLLGLVSLWPFLLIIPIIIFFWKKWRLRRKNKS